MERAHHAGDIAQGGAFQFAFAQSARRFAFEIENDEIFPGIKDLAEMIIAVNPDLGGAGAAIEQQFFLGENFLLRRQNFFGFFAKRFRQIRQLLLQEGKGAAKQSAHRLINGALRHGVERLRRKRAIIRVRSKRAMQFAGALAEQLCFLRVNAADQLVEKRAGRRGLILQIAFLGQGPARNNGRRRRASSSRRRLAGDGALQKTNHRRLRFRAAILDRAAKRRNIREIGALGQKTRDFDIGIHAIFEFAIEFEEKFVLEEHRRIALLAAQHL